MSAPPKAINRSIIPRWRDFRTTTALGEISGARKPPRSPTAQAASIPSLLAAWNEHGTKSYAADLVTSAFLSNSFDKAIDAAKYLLQRPEITPGLRRIAMRVLGGAPREPENRSDIRFFRKRTRQDPRDALSWLEMARQYISNGLPKQAIPCVDIALKLYPNDRYILRSAARFFVHIDQADRAHEILRRSAIVKTDPWVLAAEVATSSSLRRQPWFYREGVSLLASQNFSDHDLTELAGALGTIELLSGVTRKSRKLLSKALQNPTENSLAQCKWASDRIPGLAMDVDVAHFNVSHAYEAQYLESFKEQDWEGSLESARKWLEDQPFSTSPAHHGTYVASCLLEDYAAGKEIARAGLNANPFDKLLLNNFAFCLANLGEVKDAKEALKAARRLSPSDYEEVPLSATEGLIEFRLGNPIRGREMYRRAVELAGANHQSKQKIVALGFWAREETLSGSNDGTRLLTDASELAKATSEVELTSILENILRSMKKVIKQ